MKKITKFKETIESIITIVLMAGSVIVIMTCIVALFYMIPQLDLNNELVLWFIFLSGIFFIPASFIIGVLTIIGNYSSIKKFYRRLKKCYI